MTTQSYLTGRDPSSLLSAIGSWWKDLLTSRSGDEELMMLSRADVDRIAQDLGMTSDELQDFAARGVHASDEAPQMMKALGLDPNELERSQHSVYIDVLHNCAMCPDKGRCHHDIKTGEAEAHFEEYCLNAHTLNALRAVAAMPRA
jgi:hypothetical protein